VEGRAGGGEGESVGVGTAGGSRVARGRCEERGRGGRGGVGPGSGRANGAFDRSRRASSETRGTRRVPRWKTSKARDAATRRAATREVARGRPRSVHGRRDTRERFPRTDARFARRRRPALGSAERWERRDDALSALAWRTRDEKQRGQSPEGRAGRRAPRAARRQCRVQTRRRRNRDDPNQTRTPASRSIRARGGRGMDAPAPPRDRRRTMRIGSRPSRRRTSWSVRPCPTPRRGWGTA
jgi:hypothetical protein